MIKAYNETWIKNLHTRSIAADWLSRKLITDSQFAAIKAAFPSGFYQPGIFVKIGLLFFGWLGCLFFAGFASLFLLGEGSDTAITFLCLFCGVAFLFFLEYLIHTNKLYHSGIDNALLYAAIGAILTAVFLLVDDAPVGFYCVVALLLTIPAAIRYADIAAAASSFILILSLVFITFMDFTFGKLILPFVIMLVSGVTYLSVRNITDIYYLNCRKTIEILSLASFYLGGNYLVVREGNAMLSDLAGSISPQIPFAAIFYAFTLLIPALYIWYGLKTRDRLLLVMGLITIACSFYTFKHYFSTLSASQELTLAGAILILLAGAAIRYLRQPRSGISDEPAAQRKFTDLQAIIAAQVIQQPAGSGGVSFGGGNFGGGGAGESY